MDRTDDESSQIVSQLLKDREDPSTKLLAVWPSGRTLHISFASGADGDSLIVAKASGGIELRLEFDSQGPRLVVPQGNLQLKAEALTFRAENLSFDVENDVNWQVAGEFNVHSKATNLISSEDVAVNGRFIKLNCDQVPTESTLHSVSTNKNQDS